MECGCLPRVLWCNPDPSATTTRMEPSNQKFTTASNNASALLHVAADDIRTPSLSRRLMYPHETNVPQFHLRMSYSAALRAL